MHITFLAVWKSYGESPTYGFLVGCSSFSSANRVRLKSGFLQIVSVSSIVNWDVCLSLNVRRLFEHEVQRFVSTAVLTPWLFRVFKISFAPGSAISPFSIFENWPKYFNGLFGSIWADEFGHSWSMHHQCFFYFFKARSSNPICSKEEKSMYCLKLIN